MTVKELREYLAKFPDDLEIIRTYQSDFDTVDELQITVITSQQNKVAFRNGAYIRFRPQDWPGEDKPEFVTVLHFEGN